MGGENIFQNFCIPLRNFPFTHKIFAFALKTFAFFETLCLTAKNAKVLQANAKFLRTTRTFCEQTQNNNNTNTKKKKKNTKIINKSTISSISNKMPVYKQYYALLLPHNLEAAFLFFLQKGKSFHPSICI